MHDLDQTRANWPSFPLRVGALITAGIMLPFAAWAATLTLTLPRLQPQPTISVNGPTITGFSINSGASITNSATVQLNFSLGVSTTHATQYRASEKSDFAGASWQPIASPMTFTLSDGSITNTVYLQVRGLAPTIATVQSSSAKGTTASALVNSPIVKDSIALQPLGFVGLIVFDPSDTVTVRDQAAKVIAWVNVATTTPPTDIYIPFTVDKPACFNLTPFTNNNLGGGQLAFHLLAPQDTSISIPFEIYTAYPLPPQCVGTPGVALSELRKFSLHYPPVPPPLKGPVDSGRCSPQSPCSSVSGFVKLAKAQ